MLVPSLWIPWLEDLAELTFTRSSGPGGQNVNKVNTRVQVRVDLEALAAKAGLSEAQKRRLATRLAGRLVDGALTVQSQEGRSQWANREAALHRLAVLIVEALVPTRPRHATRPTRSSVERRLAGKARTARIKGDRRAPGED